VRDEIDDILADAYDEYEQAAAWEVALTERVSVPFRAALLGTPVEVRAFRASDSNAIQCLAAREGHERWIGIDNLAPEGLNDDVARLLRLYSQWASGDGE